MNINEKIGRVIKQLRTDNRMSQEQLSSICSVDQHYLSNIECGKRNVSIEILERISSAFGMQLSLFFNCVEKIDHKHDYFLLDIPASSLQESFILFMKAQNLSEGTIKKYSSDTPNCQSVQHIIKLITGTTKNMYNVRDFSLLDEIIVSVSDSEFDQIGHSMYSNGLKKYKLFLESGFSQDE